MDEPGVQQLHRGQLVRGWTEIRTPRSRPFCCNAASDGTTLLCTSVDALALGHESYSLGMAAAICGGSLVHLVENRIPQAPPRTVCGVPWCIALREERRLRTMA